ncbi:MAG: LysR family transcriptional regulator [Comamonas sp.]|jgi:DNA-binding transcriptional LysR family regulator|uniref:LysR substrate-binding domain-containing protein n=1 Tax=Comamonas sp. TaxID=34028 RepID=UPI00284C96B6|nr:LysR substrate-binding domain-containing protein [Comamonas sp.]MDR3064908.1 LysR family transcriptional regulator [Comamonas sp.]
MISQENSESSSQKVMVGPQRMPSLVALRCFEAAARLESFSRAADELHLTHGAISRAVRAVEQELGGALFERRNRRVFLNDAGRLLFDGVHAGLAQMARAAQAVRQQVAGRPLLLSCEPTLLMRWLIPRWGDFQARYPQHTVHLVAGGGAVEWGRGIDLAIRRNDFDWGRNVRVQPLCAERMGPVCQPDRLAQFFVSGAHGSLELRGGAPLLHSRTRLGAWADWRRTAPDQPPVPVQQVPGTGDLVLEHFYLSLQAAAAGLGVAMGPKLLVQDDIAAGRLVAPLGFVPDGSQYCLLSLQDEVAGSLKQLLAEWIRQQMER